MFFMGLDIVTKLKLSTCVEAHGTIEDDSSRTLCAGDTSLDRKHIGPNTLAYTISTIKMGGTNLNGVMLCVAQTRSLIVRIYRSISGTCSSRETTLMLPPKSAMSSLKLSNDQ